MAPPSGRLICFRPHYVTHATLIDGKAKAAEISAAVTESSAQLLSEHGLTPGLGVLRGRVVRFPDKDGQGRALR